MEVRDSSVCFVVGLIQFILHREATDATCLSPGSLGGGSPLFVVFVCNCTDAGYNGYHWSVIRSQAPMEAQWHLPLCLPI